MNYSETKSRLRGIRSIIESARNSQKLRGTFLEELEPFLRNEPFLTDEIEKRITYYQKLSSDPDYRRLIDEIHDSLKVLGDLLRSNEEQFWTVDKRVNSVGRVPFTLREFLSGLDAESEFLASFDGEERWFYLGKDGYPDHPLGEDSTRCPWRHVLAQYEDCVETLKDILEKTPDDKVEKTIKTYLTNIASLHELLATAWDGEKHIKYFEQFRDDLDLIKGEWNSVPARLKLSAVIVIDDLLQHIQEKERKLFPLEYHDGEFFYKNRKHYPKRKTDYMVLCDSFYPFCPKSGRMRWKDVAAKMKALGYSKPLTKESMRLLIKSLNRSVKDEKRGWHKEDILTMEKGDIVRLL